MNICIYSSELAVITGHNKYKDVGEIILKLWQKNFKDDFDEILEETNVKLETPDEYIDRISKENNIDIKQKMSECLKSDDIVSMNKTKQEIMSKFNSVHKKDRQQIKDCIKEKTNTNFGTKHENIGISRYIEEYNENVKQIDTFFKKKVFEQKYNWYLGGKIDGISENDVLIEVKNRMNRLFYKLRDYEKVQVFSYLYLLELENARLVECYKKKDKCDMNVIDIKFDKEFWDNEIMSKIIEFVTLFENFMENRQKRIDLANILLSTNTS